MTKSSARTGTQGQHFFDRDTMRFFRSRAFGRVYAGRYFVTSERGPDNVRRYTVREVTPDGRVNTVGTFQGYGTARTARTAAMRLGRAE